MSFDDPWGTYYQVAEEIDYLESAIADNAYGSSYVYREKLKELRKLKYIEYQCAMLLGIPLPKNSEHERYG